MATKSQLQQLLQEDQEPFHLHVYIAERRTKLKSSSSNNQLELARIAKPAKPISDRLISSNRESSVLHFPVTFGKKACFNGENGSPEVLNRASPVFSLTKSPVKLLQIPSKTAALLLEAALRIHKHSSRKRTNKFGTDFFGSVLKKLSVKTNKRNSIDAAKHQTTSLRSSGSGKARRDTNLNVEFSINGRRSDAVWTDDKSLDTETSCSSSNSTRTAGEHPQSPSRCLSPSPSRCTVKDVEEKEQCSPVCVLDPIFEQAVDDHNHHHHRHDDDDRYGCECSYTIVERTNQQLLHNLSRFEALAEFDLKDVEKLILEDEHDELYEESDDVALETSSSQIVSKCGLDDPMISNDMKRLVSDLIDEEEMEDEILDCRNEDHVVNKVCDRLSLWNNGVQQNTIDMMIQEELRQESCKWKMNKEELRLVAMDVEVVIFESLVRAVLT